MAKSLVERLGDRLKGISPIKVGVITTRVGPLDYYGTMQVRGFKLGIEYATSGSWQVYDRPIELYIEDDAGDPATGGQKARALIEGEGVHLLQGCVSSAVTIVVANIAKEYQRLLLVEPAAADSITGKHFNRYVFRTGASVSQDAEAGGKFATHNLGQTFCYLAPDYIFGRQSNAAWKRVIESHNGKTLGEFMIPPETTDFRPFLAEIAALRPEVLVQSWAGGGYKYLFSQIGELGIFDLMHVTGGLGDREARHALGLDAVGMVGIVKYSPILADNPINSWLRDVHMDRHGSEPDLFTGGGFVAGKVMVEALQQSKGDTSAEELVSIMEGLRFEGPKGTYEFRAEDHQALQPMYVVEMVPDPENPWAIPKLIKELTPIETAPPLLRAAI